MDINIHTLVHTYIHHVCYSQLLASSILLFFVYLCIYVCRLDFTYITLLILLQTPIFYYSHTSQEITKATDVKAMAFERPVEADRVDDLGLLSSLVRGPIMWMLGGDRDKQADKPADATLMLPPRPPMRAIREAAEEGEGTVSPGTVEGAPSPAMNKGGKSPMPAAVLCDAGSSEEEEEGEPSHDNSNANAASPLDGTHSQSLPDISSRDALPGPSRIARSQSARGPAEAASSLGGRRRTSWSDESGSPLVEYSYFYHNDKVSHFPSLFHRLTAAVRGGFLHGLPEGWFNEAPSRTRPRGGEGEDNLFSRPCSQVCQHVSFRPNRELARHDYIDYLRASINGTPPPRLRDAC